MHPSRAARLGSLERPLPRPTRTAPPGPSSAAGARRGASPETGPSGDAGFTLKVDVDLVAVEAIPRDPHGHFLDGLGRADFRVLEDGMERPITHFSRDVLPLAVALVVDRSGSVRHTLAELRDAALRTLGQLKPEDQVALFVFSDEAERWVNLTPDRTEIAQRLGDIEPSGETNVYDAIFDAAHYLKAAAPGRRHAIILVSDNRVTRLGRAGESGALRMALEAEAVVYSVQTGRVATQPGAKHIAGAAASVWIGDSESVRRIARETGGEVLDSTEDSLEESLAAVIARLKTRYTLGYAPPWTTRDGRFHRIEIRLGEEFGCPGEGYAIASRRGYYALREAPE